MTSLGFRALIRALEFDRQRIQHLTHLVGTLTPFPDCARTKSCQCVGAKAEQMNPTESHRLLREYHPVSNCQRHDVGSLIYVFSVEREDDHKIG